MTDTRPRPTSGGIKPIRGIVSERLERRRIENASGDPLWVEVRVLALDCGHEVTARDRRASGGARGRARCDKCPPGLLGEPRKRRATR